MKIMVNKRERTALLKAWKHGYLETDGMEVFCSRIANTLITVNGELVHPWVRALEANSDKLKDLVDGYEREEAAKQQR